MVFGSSSLRVFFHSKFVISVSSCVYGSSCSPRFRVENKLLTDILHDSVIAAHTAGRRVLREQILNLTIRTEYVHYKCFISVLGIVSLLSSIVSRIISVRNSQQIHTRMR